MKSSKKKKNKIRPFLQKSKNFLLMDDELVYIIVTKPSKRNRNIIEKLDRKMPQESPIPMLSKKKLTPTILTN